MPFIKNDSRINREGRPKAVESKDRKRIKDMLTAIYENSLDYLQKHEAELTLKDRIELLRIVSPFILPKLQTIHLTPEQDSEGYFKEINVNIVKE